MIKIYNRSTKKYEIEKVAGERYLKWNYSSVAGMTLLEAFIKRKAFSKLYGRYCDAGISKRKIAPFLRDFNIDINEADQQAEQFGNFNEFFARKLKEEARKVEKNVNSLISPGDGRLFAFENIKLSELVQVKGTMYSLYELIGNKDVAEQFQGGICLLLRLCPTDYHRFHFLDSGICEETNKIEGQYYSVNPIALQKIKNLYCQNKREWSLFHTEHFGEVLYVEVGATCVGTIIQSYIPRKRVEKGEEKGYFKFGGSTVIIFLQKGSVKIDLDIIEQTSLGYETKVLFGEKIGSKI